MSNRINVMGNATRDAELRFTTGGRAVTTFSVASNRRWQNRDTQEWEEAVAFFDVKCWGPLAEHVAETVTRGIRVMVEGRLDQESWTTPEGEKRSKLVITADDVGVSLRFATATVQRAAPSTSTSEHPKPAPSTRRADVAEGKDEDFDDMLLDPEPVSVGQQSSKSAKTDYPDDLVF